jgi:hypothetical protein
MSKKLTKFFAFTYSQFKHICKVSPKTDTFCGLCKKTKIVMWNVLFLAPFFLHTPDNTSICHAMTLWACSTWRCTCEFFVSFFWHFKTCQICVSKYMKHMLTGAKTLLPCISAYYMVRSNYWIKIRKFLHLMKEIALFFWNYLAF